MTFIRFSGCNLSCNYCDTPETQNMKGVFVNQGTVTQNPTDIDTVLGLIDASIVTLTGGEPLLQVEAAQQMCDRLKALDKIVYLDTNATLPDALNTIIENVDIVSLDFKIPTATGRPQLWSEHESCLEIAKQKDAYVKMVVNENLLPRELDTTCSIIQRIKPSTPLVIQPVFGNDSIDLLDIQKKALDTLDDVRIIPQIHKYIHLQ